MLNLFKHIREVFNKPSVKNEDWLDPSDRVLFNIEAEINKDNNKDRSILFFILPALLFLVGVSFVLFFNFQNQILRVNSKNKKSAEPTILARTIDKENIEFEAIPKKNEHLDILAPSSSFENKKLDLEGRQEINRKNLKLEPTLNNNYTGENNDLSINFVVKNISPSVNSGNNRLQSQPIIKNSSDSKNSIKDFNSVYPNHNIENIEYLNLGNVDLIFVESSLPNLSNYKMFESENSENQNQLFIEASMGVAYWDFNLNDNFRELVEPAAFDNSNALGFNTSLRIGKEISSKFGVSVNLDYTNVRLSSGHNSALIFDNTVDQQNHSVTMATPLGFVNNEVALFRTSGSNIGETNLLVNLENEHQVEALEFSAAVDIKIVSNDQIRLTLSPGVGLQQILSSKNELASLTTNNTDIESSNRIIESEFDDLNTLSPTASLGLSMRKELIGGWVVGFGLDTRVNINPIQEYEDLNTRVMRYNGNLVLRKKF